ncbi:DUF2264 domain-containing protein [Mucilaginibacter sp. PAMB04274]|uniref:DUF2264 domain-containing protein n=1 Tax=Mucilaginibacter sp. PAMB04274 TaxID=3138568 RepID=UPI0031F6C2FE
MKKLCFLFLTLLQFSQLNAHDIPPNDRAYWLSQLNKVARPVFSNLADDKLKANMPVLTAEHPDDKDIRSKVAYLEAFGRTLSGIAPWLNLEGGSSAEQKLRNQYREWAVKAVGNAVNPKAKDYMQWQGAQPLVDGAFFALGLIRCPWLWQHLSVEVQQQTITALKITRTYTPNYNNWLLFSGVIEAFFCKYGVDYDAMRIDYGIRQFMGQWYVGDGVFSDGDDFRLDYYNSYVIQPFLTAMLEIINTKTQLYADHSARLSKITKRYAEIQELMINTDGSYPTTGRSIVYRGAAFQHLANMALKKQLPEKLAPSQVRAALTAVITKTLSAPQTFMPTGWLNMGLHGKQIGLADFYITTGSLYLCANIFLPLGLPSTDEFWSAPAKPWSAVKVWTGQEAIVDHALDMK